MTLLSFLAPGKMNGMSIFSFMNTFYSWYQSKYMNNVFISACEHGKLERVRYYLIKHRWKHHIHLNDDQRMGFYKACQNGHLEIVKYLLTSQDLIEHVDINKRGSLAFLFAAEYGHSDIIHYLMLHPEFSQSLNSLSESTYNFSFLKACKNGHLHVVQALSHFSLLNLFLKDDILKDSFFEACRNKHEPIICHLLDTYKNLCLEIQSTKFNLDWAFEQKYSDVIAVMMKELKRRDFIQYIHYLPQLKNYNTELYDMILTLKVDNISNSISEETLFL